MARRIVVVGAGAAGCALARRLSDVPDVDVLLMEAGGAATAVEVQTPAMWPAVMGGRFDYRYESVPQPAAQARVYPVPRGKGLGGTTIMNAMIHAHPSAAEVAQWGVSFGPGARDRILEVIDGKEGLVPTRQGFMPNPVCAAFVEASLEAGYPRSAGLNTDSPAGAGWFELSIDAQGERVDAYRAYLAHVAERPNLTVWTSAVVHRLEIAGGRVRSIEGTRSGEPFAVTDADEVVLSAGAIDSPALLLRSGVGPAAELAEVGLRPVADLEGVGRNLHDHPLVPVVWASEATGPAPANQLFESYLLLPSERRAAGQTLNIAFGHIPFPLPGVEMPAAGASALVGLYSPRSRGSLRLASADPARGPVIDPGYLSAGTDVRALASGIEIVRQIAGQPALAAFGLTEVAPGPAATDATALEAFVRASSSAYFHPVGTCSAGGPHPVVDDQLRVIGLDNLRIADTSILPAIPAVATSVTAQLIGWRAAELILGTP